MLRVALAQVQAACSHDVSLENVTASMAFKRSFPSHQGGGGSAKFAKKGKGSQQVLAEPLPVGMVPAGMAASAGFSSSSTTPAVRPLPPATGPPPFPINGPIEPAKSAALDPVPDHKSALCQFLGKSLHISLGKGDVQFNTVKMGLGGYKSSCACPRLPNKHQGSWVGECYTDKKAAEQSAAGAALRALMGIPELVASAAMSKEERLQQKQNRIAQWEQEKYSKAIQAQVDASQKLLQQQQLAAYVQIAQQAAQQQQQAQLAQIAAQQQQRQQHAATIAQLQQSLAASAAASLAASGSSSSPLPTLPSLPSVPALDGLNPGTPGKL